MITLVLLAAAGPAHAGFIKGPYLQNARQDSIVVSVQLDTSAACQVDYGPTSALGDTASSAAATFHEIALAGLTVSTVYSYQVTCGGDVSAPATFATQPHTDEPFSFLVVGDTRTDGDEHQAVMDQVLATVGYPDFYINTGDLIEDGDDGDQWSDFFDIESELMAGTPTYPVAGNHDDVANESYYTQFFNLPTDTSATENWYSLQHGNSLFIVIDTNEDYLTGSDQHEWIESVLADGAANSDIRHIFAFFHHPPYSSGGHGVLDSEEWQQGRSYLSPLMAEYGVDVVFNGHDHHYERSDKELTDGVTYIVTGGGGAPGAPGDFVDGTDGIAEWLGMAEGETLGEFLEEDEWLLGLLQGFGYAEDYEEGWWRAEAEVMKHFILVEVQGSLVTASVYTKDGDLFEEWTLGSYDPDIVDDDGDGFTEAQGDCDDADDTVNPDATDECDGVDNDCDGQDNGCGGDDTGAVDTGGDDTGGDHGGGAGGGDGGGDEGDPAVEVDPEGGCGCGATGAASGVWLALLGLGAAVRRRSGLDSANTGR